MDEQVQKQRKRKKRSAPPPPPDMKSHRYHSRKAAQKLKEGKELDEIEIMSLFKTDLIDDEDINKIVEQFISSVEIELTSDYRWTDELNIVTSHAKIWCPNVESEMISFFRRNPEQLYSMTPRKFEELVAAIFKNNGFSVELTPETRDGGIDIIAVHKSILTGETVHFVECKRYAPENKVGIGIVQRLLGTVSQKRANKGVIVTTSFFTREAETVAKETENILSLKDYNDILGWLRVLTSVSN
jgi:restriction system protein